MYSLYGAYTGHVFTLYYTDATEPPSLENKLYSNMTKPLEHGKVEQDLAKIMVYIYG